MTSVEFSPHEYFNRIFNYWWIVLLATIVGSVFGFAFYQLHAPMYEATATYFVTLDLTRFPIQAGREDTIQYNEDMALNTTGGALLSTNTLDDVVLKAQGSGIKLTAQDLLNNYTIERKQDLWELRYRNQDPRTAQQVTNMWAESGYQEMLRWQQTGLTPTYVILQSPTLALLPQRPVVYGRNNVLLAGAMIGFIAGIVIAVVLSHRTVKLPQGQG